MKKNNNKINYFSTDKMYTVNNTKKLDDKIKIFSIFITSIILFLVSIFFLASEIIINGREINVDYSEKGTVDYVVYLKDNNYYKTKYLKSGMKYVASIINTINPKFNYEIHSNEEVLFNYEYEIVGTLKITDVNDSSKILFTSEEELLSKVKKNIRSNNIVINEDIIIDYDKYNEYVNSFKRDYGLSVNSSLILNMNILVNGENSKSEEKMNRDNTLQIEIPLSEQTIDISINTENIDNVGALTTLKKVTIKNPFTVLLGIIMLVLSIIGISIFVELYQKYTINNIYDITVNKILKEYDRLIVNATMTINEKLYKNIIHPNKFTEMVDASTNLGEPILFYNVIPGEKCFFIIIKGDTLYKYRLTKAYLENEEKEK